MRSLLPAVLLASGCAGNATFSLGFVAEVAGAPFACDATYGGIGTGGGTISFLDARMYVHDVRFLGADGEPLRTELDEDEWQSRGIALLDFEDDGGSCATGSSGTHTEITGVVDGKVAGVAFEVGVPSELNHLDAATAEAPLNAPGMWWSWVGGYKYARVDVKSEGHDSYFFHLGATSCAGTPAEGFACAWGNVAHVTLDAFDPESDVVTLDLAALYAGVDVEAASAEGDVTPGCMSFPGDPECASMMGAFGVGYTDVSEPGPQSLFTVGVR